MKLIRMAVVGIVVLAAQASAGEAPALKTQKERMSYGIGADVARTCSASGSTWIWTC